MDIIEDENRVVLTDEEWQWLQAELNRPPRFLPRLAKLFDKPTLWENDGYLD